jgi:hypothetical protein
MGPPKLRHLSNRLADILLVLGAALIPAGVALVHPPTAIAVLGVESLAFALLITMGRR